jgi:hypothetical protein
VASRARVEAERAQETLRAAQRSYDAHLLNAEQATRAADPRTIRAAKDEAQRTFRANRGRATEREAVDAAARDWLLEINRINLEARTAAAAAAKEQESARSLAGSLDRLTVEADAARIAGETADEACLNARQGGRRLRGGAPGTGVFRARNAVGRAKWPVDRRAGHGG